MGAFWTYLLQSAVSLVLLYGVYQLFLRRDTFFQANRFYLLGSVLFSLAIPWIFISHPAGIRYGTYAMLLDPVTVTPDEMQGTVARHLPLFEMLLTIYLTGVILFTARFIYQLVQIRTLIRRNSHGIKPEEKIILLSAPHAPFSFFRMIFISRDMLGSPEIRQVIEHERVHIRQYHSLDIMLMEALTIVQWFNPVIWLYRRSVKELHEYLADQGVIGKGADLTEYQAHLLNQAMGIQVNDLTHNFNHSLLKKRFMMMTREKSGLASRWKLLMPVPVILALTMAFSGSMVMAQEEQKVPAKIEKNADVAKDTGKDVRQDAGADTQNDMIVPPSFTYEGGDLATYLVTNIHYPDQAREKGITGKVFVRFTVDKKGKVINPEIVKSSNPVFDQEALRVVKQMSGWTPGKNDQGKAVSVEMTLPIVFALEKEKK